MLVARHGRRIPHAERDRLILEHQTLVRQIAISIQRRASIFLNLDDLISAGTQGLIRAAHRFDANRHSAFSDYARKWIRGAMIDVRSGWYQRHVEHCVLEHLPAQKHGATATDTRAVEVRQAIGRLKPRQQRILALYYTDGYTLAEIAGQLNLTRGRVSQLHAEAVEALREILQ